MRKEVKAVTQSEVEIALERYRNEIGSLKHRMDEVQRIVDAVHSLARVCHFLKHIETKISLFCKVFLAFFMLLLYNIFVGTTVFSRRVSCLLKPFRIMGKNI